VATEDIPLASFRFLLAGLQESVRDLFIERAQAPAAQRALLQRRALLGLELLCKLEEQVLLPALQPGKRAPPSSHPWAAAEREMQLLRDMALLASQSPGAQRELALAALEGLAALHFERIDDLIEHATAATAAPTADWRALHREAKELLGRWYREVATQGHVEDEEADPVGHAPR
jgi:hypothetical protein